MGETPAVTGKYAYIVYSHTNEMGITRRVFIIVLSGNHHRVFAIVRL